MGPHSLSFFPPLANTVGLHSQEGIVANGGHGNLVIEDQSPQIKPSYATMVVSSIVGENQQDGLCRHKLGNLGQETLVKGDSLKLKDIEVGDAILQINKKAQDQASSPMEDLSDEMALLSQVEESISRARNKNSKGNGYMEEANSSGSGEIPMHIDEHSSVGLADVSPDKSKCDLLQENGNSYSNGLSKTDLHQYEGWFGCLCLCFLASLGSSVCLPLLTSRCFSMLVCHAVGRHLVLGFVLLLYCLGRATAVLWASAAAKGILMAVVAVRRSLNNAARTTPDRQAACRCLKSSVGAVKGVNIGLAGSLPGKCGVNIPYKISLQTDCTK
ncbi:hypothetical protein U1Q18_001629 [Sarracenia purpurea var. burkii]